jgi:hypothetical protein
MSVVNILNSVNTKISVLYPHSTAPYVSYHESKLFLQLFPVEGKYFLNEPNYTQAYNAG